MQPSYQTPKAPLMQGYSAEELGLAPASELPLRVEPVLTDDEAALLEDFLPLRSHKAAGERRHAAHKIYEGLRGRKGYLTHLARKGKR